MRRFEREVVDYKLIEAMLQEMNIINVGMNDEDGFPYVVPMSFGFEMTDAHLNVYTHFMKVGKKVELLRKIQEYVLNLVSLMIFLIRNIKDIIMIIVV